MDTATTARDFSARMLIHLALGLRISAIGYLKTLDLNLNTNTLGS